MAMIDKAAREGCADILAQSDLDLAHMLRCFMIVDTSSHFLRETVHDHGDKREQGGSEDGRLRARAVFVSERVFA
jgi:hypothetical protein